MKVFRTVFIALVILGSIPLSGCGSDGFELEVTNHLTDSGVFTTYRQTIYEEAGYVVFVYYVEYPGRASLNQFDLMIEYTGEAWVGFSTPLVINLDASTEMSFSLEYSSSVDGDLVRESIYKEMTVWLEAEIVESNTLRFDLGSGVVLTVSELGVSTLKAFYAEHQ